MMLVRKLVGLAAAMGLVIGASGQAFGATLSLDSAAAAVAAPVITGIDESLSATTLVTVTNAGEAVVLHINVISGDYGDDWEAQNFDCLVTQDETVLFVFEPAGQGSRLSYECNQGDQFDNDSFIDRTPMITRNGIMFVSIEDAVTGQTENTDQLIADWVVIDGDAGRAFSAGAIPFQGGTPGGGDGDRKYRFDGTEYKEFPAALATNFIAPGGGIGAYLVLFTLDGTAGVSGLQDDFGPPVALSVLFYNDDEVQYSAGHAFDCFDIVELREIDPRFSSSGLGSDAGHLTLTPELAVYPDIAHDSQYDGGGVIGVRKTPVHGWLVQTVGGGEVVKTYETNMRDGGAWARELAQSQLPLEPATGDTPVYGGR